MSHSGFQPFQQGFWRGEIADCLESHLGGFLSLIEDRSPRETLKRGSAREVWVEETPAGPVCVKEYFYPKNADRWLRILRGSRAQREWVRLRAFWAEQVPIPEPLAWLESDDESRDPRSLVVTRLIPSARTLDEFLRTVPSPFSRWKTARATGETLARMHAMGARHDDLHPGNLLVHERNGEPEVLVLDLHEVRLKRSLSWNARLLNLATLYGGLRHRLSAREKQHALRSYLLALQDWKPPFRSEREARVSMGRALEEMACSYFRRRCRKRVRKCVRHGKRFHAITVGDYRGWIRAEWDVPELLKKLESPNSWIDSSDCRILKHTPTTTVVRATFAENAPPVFLKRYNRKDWWEKTKNLFRHSRAMKVWRAGYLLEVMGIPTPETVAMLERRDGGLLQESFILTEWIEGGAGLDDFWNEHARAGSSSPLATHERILLRRRVAQLFASLHSLRVSHGDLKGRNILLDLDQPPPFSPAFVDLDAIRFSPLRFQRSRINDLSRLLFSVYANAPLLTQIRFFKDYCNAVDPDLWRRRHRWWRRIAGRTERKLREKGLL